MDGMQFFGRRKIYIFAFLFFIIWLIPCAVAQNIETLLIARFFSGIPASAFLSVAGGTVGDIFRGHELGLPMMVYTVSPFLGPELGPLYVSRCHTHPPASRSFWTRMANRLLRMGGFICQNASW